MKMYLGLLQSKAKDIDKAKYYVKYVDFPVSV